MYDYHTHHYRCGHAQGAMHEYIETAIAKGFREIGLSDHSPIFHFGDDPHPLPKTAMARDEFPRYIAEMQELKEAYKGKITVRLGVESDYILGWDDHYRALWQQYDLDYVIGSVHWIGRWSIFNTTLPEGHTVESIFEEYLESIAAAARSGIYDIIGHFDAFKTYRPMPKGFENKIRAVMETIADAGVAIELNTSGWRKVCAEQYPSYAILTEAHRLGVPVALGSDAHEPHLVGAGFDRALSILSEIGFTHIAAFANRERRLIPLSEAAVA